MKNIIVLALVCVMFLISSCDKVSEIKPKAESQFVEIEVRYTGTAQSVYRDNRNLYLKIKSDEGFEWTLMSNTVTSSLKDGLMFKTSQKLEPGGYSVKGYFDWNNSGEQDSNEPEIERTNFEITGFETENISVNLIDRTSPSDNGRFLFYAEYSGFYTGSYELSVSCKTINDEIIKLKKSTYKSVQYDGNWLVEINDLPSGDYKWINVYWDVNGNERLDIADPKGSSSDILHISPGLTTVIDNVSLIDPEIEDLHIYVSDDAYVNKIYSGSNYGDASDIRVGGENYKSFFKFDIPNEILLLKGRIKSVKLNLVKGFNNSSQKPVGDLDIYIVVDRWYETTISYNNIPEFGQNSVASEYNITFDVSGVLSFDVTDSFKSFLPFSKTWMSYMAKANEMTNSGRGYFYSKEGYDSGKAWLDIEYY